MEVQAFAKLNLTLDILGKRPDGYHDLRMVMQSITLADTLTLEENQGEGLRVSANLRFLPTGEKNLAAAAALRFWEALGRGPEGLDIHIQKRIPVCVAGKCCESGDLVVKDAQIQPVEKGDLLCVFSTGAYNYSMASNYNRIPRPPVVFLRQGKHRLAVRRETYEQLVQNDL